MITTTMAICNILAVFTNYFKIAVYLNNAKYNFQIFEKLRRFGLTSHRVPCGVV